VRLATCHCLVVNGHRLNTTSPIRSDNSMVNSAIVAEVTQASSQLSGNGGGSFSSDFGFFQGLKIGVPSGCFGKTSIFKIIMTDDITLVVKARIYMVKSTRLYGRTI